jgi:hypothetical protein
MLLILPIVVLGQQVLNNRTSWTGLFGFCFLMLLLSIPHGTLVFPFSTKAVSAAVNVHTASISTLSLIVLTVWIARVRMRTVSSSS